MSLPTEGVVLFPVLYSDSSVGSRSFLLQVRSPSSQSGPSPSVSRVLGPLNSAPTSIVETVLRGTCPPRESRGHGQIDPVPSL